MNIEPAYIILMTYYGSYYREKCPNKYSTFPENIHFPCILHYNPHSLQRLTVSVHIITAIPSNTAEFLTTIYDIIALIIDNYSRKPNWVFRVFRNCAFPYHFLFVSRGIPHAMQRLIVISYAFRVASLTQYSV